jgi:hypothetical protein
MHSSWHLILPISVALIRSFTPTTIVDLAARVVAVLTDMMYMTNESLPHWAVALLVIVAIWACNFLWACKSEAVQREEKKKSKSTTATMRAVLSYAREEEKKGLSKQKNPEVTRLMELLWDDVHEVRTSKYGIPTARPTETVPVVISCFASYYTGGKKSIYVYITRAAASTGSACGLRVSPPPGYEYIIIAAAGMGSVCGLYRTRAAAGTTSNQSGSWHRKRGANCIQN